MTTDSRSLRQLAGRSSRPRQHRISYREESTSCESSPDDDFTDLSPSFTSRPQPIHTLRRPHHGTRGNDPLREKRKPASTTFKYPSTKRPRKSGERQKGEDDSKCTGATDNGRKPAWHTLPYHILLQVFEYAVQPAVQTAVLPQSSIQWLLATSRTCKAFAEPAISVLYYKPPLEPLHRARAFVAHLQNQNERSYFNYRAKVKYLDVKVLVLSRKYQGHASLKIEDLLDIVPQLRGLNIIRQEETCSDPWSESSISKAVQIIRDAVRAAEANNLHLQEWRWDAVASSCRQQFDLLKIHRSAVFQNLRRLTIVCWHVKHRHAPESDKSFEEFGKAISALANLEELRLVRCPDVNSELLPLLPQGLQGLEISNCPIDSKMLRRFLASHGHGIRRLVLNHNRSLNLAFLDSLSDSCPALEVLTMDLIYHSAHVAYSDTEPRYKQLLPSGMVPTWPASLRHLELNHLRQWDNNAAEEFFTSLVESAGDLLDLRQLMIKASLNESNWRERISFRDRWIARFDKVFLRKSEPPYLHLRSIAAFNAEKAREASGIPLKMKLPHHSPKRVVPITRTNPTVPEQTLSRPKRNVKSSNIQSQVVIHDSPSDSDSPHVHSRRRCSRLAHNDSDSYTSPSLPRPKRHRRRRNRSNCEDSSSEDSALDDPFSPPDDGNSGSQTSHEAEVDVGAFVVQGMCDVVRIVIDNLRPMEEQLDEDDFMDEEASGDEDWNGDDVREDEDVVAW